MHSTIQTPSTVKMIPCIKCRGDMPELRKPQNPKTPTKWKK